MPRIEEMLGQPDPNYGPGHTATGGFGHRRIQRGPRIAGPVTKEMLRKLGLSPTPQDPTDGPQWWWVSSGLFLLREGQGPWTLCAPDSDPTSWHVVCSVTSMEHLGVLLNVVKGALQGTEKANRPPCPFAIIPMPYNAQGLGPEMDPTKVVETEWQVWDDCNRCIAVLRTDHEELATVENLQAWGGVRRHLNASHMVAFAGALDNVVICRRDAMETGWTVSIADAWGNSMTVQTNLITNGQMYEALRGCGVQLK